MRVVITGGAGALGRGVGAVFAGQGHEVVATCFRAADAEQIGPRVRALFVDLRDRDAVERAAREVGPIDALVCCAGGFATGELLTASPEVYDTMMDLNVRTTAWALATFGGRITDGGAAVLVGARTWAGAAGVALYAASKAAVVSLGRSAALEWRPRGVRVNVLLPDLIDTPANRRAMPTADFEKWARPEEIGDVVAWLCSPAARLVTGQAIDVGR